MMHFLLKELARRLVLLDLGLEFVAISRICKLISKIAVFYGPIISLSKVYSLLALCFFIILLRHIGHLW